MPRSCPTLSKDQRIISVLVHSMGTCVCNSKEQQKGTLLTTLLEKDWCCKKWKFYSNQEFIRHLDEKQDCFLHYLILKYMESIYIEEMKGLLRHIPFGSPPPKK